VLLQLQYFTFFTVATELRFNLPITYTQPDVLSECQLSFTPLIWAALIYLSTTLKGHAVAQLVEALLPEGRKFDSRCCHWNFSLT
jgi:hypothetical protein